MIDNNQALFVTLVNMPEQLVLLLTGQIRLMFLWYKTEMFPQWCCSVWLPNYMAV